MIIDQLMPEDHAIMTEIVKLTDEQRVQISAASSLM